MCNPIHVCIVTTAHAVDDPRVNSKMAHAFREAGFRVTWVGPGYAFFDWIDYNRDGITFVLAPPNHNRLDRIVSGVRVRHLAKTIKDVDVYYTPEPDSAGLALSLARRNGAKVILDIHEVYHGPMLDRWLMGWNCRPVRKFVRRRIGQVCSRCDLVAGVSKSVLDPYFTDQDKRMIVRSCAPSWFAEGQPTDVCGVGRKRFTFMHGKGALQRGTETVIAAVARIARDAPNLRVIMFTREKPESDVEAKALISMGQKRSVIDFLDLRKGVPMHDMPGILRACDVGLIAYGRDLGVDSLPNRLFEYMAVGLPIIAPLYAVEIAKIIKTEKCGLLADCEDPISIAAAMMQLYSTPEVCREMGRNSREAFLRRHNWEVEVRPLLARMRSWFPDRRSA